MSTIYKGAIRYKKKSELLEIAEALKIDLVPASRGGHPSGIKREEFEVLIKDHLAEHDSELRGQEQWAGLYESIDNENKRQMRNSMVGIGNGKKDKSEGSDVSDSPENSSRSPRKHSGGRASSTSRSFTNGLSSLTNQTPLSTPLQNASGFSSALAGRARRSIEGLREAFVNGAGEARDEVEDLSQEVSQAGASLTHKLKVRYNFFARKVRRQFKQAQGFASDSENITKSLIIIEALTFLIGLTPTTLLSSNGTQHLSATKFVKTGGSSATRGLIPHWALTLPDVRALASVAYWQPVLLWGIWTLAIPMFFAHLITFDRRNQASVLTFGLVRLFSILYLAILGGSSTSSLFSSSAVPSTLGVAAGEPAVSNIAGFKSNGLGLGVGSLSYQHVSQHINPTTQLLLTGAMISFSLYETIASRPRAL